MSGRRGTPFILPWSAPTHCISEALAHARALWALGTSLWTAVAAGSGPRLGSCLDISNRTVDESREAQAG